MPFASDSFAPSRVRMVADQIAARGIRDPEVLKAMAAVPRHRFVPQPNWDQAYADHPLPIGYGQTISQPYIVAAMAEALALTGRERVLEVGSGSGYMAAVLGQLAAEVHGVELEPALVERSTRILADLRCHHIHIHGGNGSEGLPEFAPFDAILLSCATPRVPPALAVQLAPGGTLLLPLGLPWGCQELVLAQRLPEGLTFRHLMSVAFVPLR